MFAIPTLDHVLFAIPTLDHVWFVILTLDHVWFVILTLHLVKPHFVLLGKPWLAITEN